MHYVPSGIPSLTENKLGQSSIVLDGALTHCNGVAIVGGAETRKENRLVVRMSIARMTVVNGLF